MVGEEHTADPPLSVTYSYVVSRDLMRLLLVAAINEWNILAHDMQNAYLTAKYREKYIPLQDLSLDLKKDHV